jgi:hypothetical protein
MFTPQSTASHRDPFLDSWRGIFHIVMLVDHMPIVFPGFFTLIASWFEPLGYVSVAEGFVFLSGFVSGLVYTRIKRERGESVMWHKALARARDIYLCYILAVVALVALAKWGGRANLGWGSWSFLLNLSLPVAALKTVALLYQPAFLEILPMYCLFVLATPLMLHFVEKGNQLLVGGISLLIWGAAQCGLRHILLRLLQHYMDVRFGNFNAFAWQILFVAGLMCGHKTYNTKASWLPVGWKLPVLAYGITLLCFFLHHDLLWTSPGERWAGRSYLGPIRLLNFASITFLICKGRGWIEKFIAWRGYAFLSRHSLQVFAFHLFPFYFVGLALEGRTSLPAWLQLLAILLCIGGLFFIAFLSRCFKDLHQRFACRLQARALKLAS